MKRLPALRASILNPVTITGLILVLYVGAVLWAAGGDPLALVRLGTQYSQGEPAGTQGYDGQFVFYIARDPRPDSVAPFLDAPAYRYQRILLPLLARAMTRGQADAIPWALLAIGVGSHLAGTWVVARLLEDLGVSRWWALPYGLWVGLLLSVRLALPEPLAYALIAAAILATRRERPELGWVLYAMALFAKEVVALFLLAQAAADLWNRRGRRVAGLALVAGVPFVAFQGWLWWQFGAPGIGSGGAMATPFELVPFMGLLRVGAYSWALMWAIFAVVGPFVYAPAVWGLASGARKWLAGGREMIVAALVVNALVIPFTPFSTVREPGAMLRLASGLVLAVLLYAARYRKRRVLSYSIAWIALNVFLLKG